MGTWKDLHGCPENSPLVVLTDALKHLRLAYEILNEHFGMKCKRRSFCYELTQISLRDAKYVGRQTAERCPLYGT
jgi:hypothetical protein